MRREGITTIAAETGSDRGTALKILAAAGVTRDPHDKTFPYEAACEALLAAKDSGRTISRRAGGNGFRELTDEQQALARSKATVEQERARKLRLQNDVLESRLIERDAVTQTMRDLAARLRTSLLQIPARVAPRLAGETNTLAIRSEIETTIRDALTAFVEDAILSDEKALGL